MKKLRRLIIGMLTVALLSAVPVSQATAAVKKGIPVLMYHSISKTEENPNKNSSITSEKKFREEMEQLKAEGFTAVFFSDYTAYMEKGTPLPEKPVIITFDDGYMDNYTIAYPILKELGMKATISIVVASVGLSEKNGKPIIPHFTWEQAREMQESGVIDIQCHTFDLHGAKDPKGLMKIKGENDIMYKHRIKQDTLKAKSMIEKEIGNKVDVFVYPYGYYNDITESVMKELGFKYTLSVNEGVTDIEHEGAYLIKRINMTPFVTTKDLINKFNVVDVYY